MRIKGRIRGILRREWAIAVVVAAFLTVAAIYSIITPLFEASDEIWHYPVVKHIADTGTLPVQRPGVEQPWRQEGSQPPLYYMVAALATSWIDTADMAEILWPNPHAQIGVPLAEGNKNMIIHTAQESFPYRGTTLAVHIIRFLSVLMGAATVLLTYLVSLELFPSRQSLAIGAAAINAFNPMFIFISGSVCNDNLVVSLSSLALLLILRLMKGPSSRWILIALGSIIGLAAITKVSALGLVPLAFLALGYLAFQQRSWSAFLKGCLLVSGPILILASWWYARNWVLYGDPLGLGVMVAIAGSRFREPSLAQLLGEFQGFKMAYWAVFGGCNILAGRWVYAFFDILGLLASAGLIVVTIKGLMRRSWERTPSLLLLALWVVILFLGLARWTQVTKASTGRLLFPGISALSLFLALGLEGLLGRKYDRYLLGSVVVVMLFIAFLSPFRYIAPAYARPRLLSPDELEAVANHLGISFGHKMRLLGYTVDRETIAPGESLTVTLYWQSEAEIDRDYSIFVHLLDEIDAVVAQADSYPGMGTYPTSEWAVGDAIAERYTLRLPGTTFAPSSAVLEVGVYDYSTGKRLLAYSAEGQPVGDNVMFHPISIEGTSPRGQPVAVFVNFENVIALVAYQVDRRSVNPGEGLELTLYWRALAKPSADYTVFAHLLGPGTRMWAQHDGPPEDGRSPTSTWKPDQIVEDRHTLTVAADTPPGVYEIEVGLYSPATGERLLVLGDRDQVVGDHVLLTSVRVAD